MTYVFKAGHELAFFVIAVLVGIATEYVAHSDITDLHVLWPLLAVAAARALAGAIITKFTTNQFIGK